MQHIGMPFMPIRAHRDAHAGLRHHQADVQKVGRTGPRFSG
jgi:hypothetical protein